jgi:hypothetical protein
LPKKLSVFGAKINLLGPLVLEISRFLRFNRYTECDPHDKTEALFSIF